MNLQQLFSMQKRLDDYILQQHRLELADLFFKKVLALQVELGELANEMKTFKYWSTKPPGSREKILEEYVDGLHFVLSLGLDMGYSDDVADEDLSIHEADLHGHADLSETFVYLFRCVGDFAQTQSLQQYRHLFAALLGLGKHIGFTAEETERAYLAKNEVNYRRQTEGY